MALTAGTRLGPYEIQSALGAGGMGEVYRARDTRLERTVAIKVLPEKLSSDLSLRLRLEREARAISKLSHPHICTLHDIGHQEGMDFLVMELVEGETLEQRLMKGPLPAEQVLRYAAQIADASAQAAGAQKSVQVGTFTLSSTDTYGTGYFYTLDASAITSEPICFGAVTVIVDGHSHTFLASDGGIGATICTLPLIDPPYPNQFLVLGCDQNTTGCWDQCVSTLGIAKCSTALPSCFNGCSNITLQLISTTGKAFSFTLLSGRKFKTYGVNTSVMSPQPGQLFIVPGQVAPLYLYRDPSGK